MTRWRYPPSGWQFGPGNFGFLIREGQRDWLTTPDSAGAVNRELASSWCALPPPSEAGMLKDFEPRWVKFLPSAEYRARLRTARREWPKRKHKKRRKARLVDLKKPAYDKRVEKCVAHLNEEFW